MAENFIFTMQDLRKVKGGKEILKGIWLSFYPGAKIGVIGPNGGGKRRVALCAILLARPDLLLLDEPTNHLDAESVLWLEQHLKEYPGTIVSVTHDRYFLDNVA